MLIALYHAIGYGVKFLAITIVFDVLLMPISPFVIGAYYPLVQMLLVILALREVSLLIDTHIRRSGGNPTVKRLGDYIGANYHIGIVDPHASE